MSRSSMRAVLLRVVCASVCLLPVLTSSGCYGKSIVTSSVLKWHHELDTDKWVMEGIYVPLFFFVLPITSLVDNFILNSIDFWTKDDPLSASVEPGTPSPSAPAQAEEPRVASRTAETTAPTRS